MIGLFKARNPQLYPKSHFQVPHVHRIRESLWNHAVCKLPKCNQNITLWLNFANQKRRKLSEKTNILDNAILNFIYALFILYLHKRNMHSSTMVIQIPQFKLKKWFNNQKRTWPTQFGHGNRFGCQYYGVSVVWGGEFLAVINQQLFLLMLVSEWGWWWIKQSLSFLSTARLNRRFLWRKS